MHAAASSIKSAVTKWARPKLVEWQADFKRTKYAANIHVVKLFSESRAKVIATKANEHAVKSYRKAKNITPASVPAHEAPKFSQDTASTSAPTKSSQSNRTQALENCTDFIEAEKKAMGRRDDVVAEKGVVHVISKSIDRISAQIGKSGSTMSQEDQATLDASLANALSTFDSDAHDALRESSPGKYDQALKALHYAVTLASMQRD